jgi:serine/threonine protein kinase
MIDKTKFKEMEKEICNLCNPLINKENIIKIFGYYYDSDYYPLVLELAIADLNKFIENNDDVYKEHWTKIDTKNILYDITNGILSLHQNQPSIIHLDLKPENILIVDRNGDGKLRACIGDFGKSKQAIKSHCVATCSGAVGTRVIINI